MSNIHRAVWLSTLTSRDRMTWMYNVNLFPFTTDAFLCQTQGHVIIIVATKQVRFKYLDPSKYVINQHEHFSKNTLVSFKTAGPKSEVRRHLSTESDWFIAMMYIKDKCMTNS